MNLSFTGVEDGFGDGEVDAVTFDGGAAGEFIAVAMFEYIADGKTSRNHKLLWCD